MTLRATSVVVCLAAFTASRAHAQDIVVSVRAFDGREVGTFDLLDLSSVAAQPITRDECASGSEITLRFANVDTTRTALFWFRGAMCDDPIVRNDTSSTSCAPLDASSVAIEGFAQVEATLPVSALAPCELEGTAGLVELWVLALDNITDTVTSPGQKARFSLAYDYRPPLLPPDATYTGIESGLEVTLAGDAPRVEVFLDPAGCSDGVPTSAAFGEPPDPRYSLGTFTASSSLVVPWPDTVPIPGEAAVAVRAIDGSGRAGPLSAPACVERVSETTTTSGGGCTIAPSRSAALPWLGWLAVVLLSARRRSQRIHHT